MKKIKVVIVGYGKMGRIRANTVDSHDDMELVGVCDVLDCSDELTVPFVKQYKRLMEYSPDCVFVCITNNLVLEIVRFFMENKVHVFCEKPPGRSLKDVENILQVSRNNPRLKLKFGFNHRYHQSLLESKSLVDKGRLGEILWMRGIYGKGGGNLYDKAWRNKYDISGGGILIDQGIHMVDLFRFFCGDFEEVNSFVQKSYWDIEVEDNVFALLRNNKGQVGMLHSSATQWKYKFLLDVYLEKGYISISGILSSTMNYGTEKLKIARCRYDKQGYPLPNPDETITYFDEDKSWHLELDEFYHCIVNDEPVKVGTCEEACKTMKLVEELYASDRNWHWPRIQEQV